MGHYKYAPMEQAANYAKENNLTSISKWIEASELPDFPDNLPKRPPNVYGCKWSDIIFKKPKHLPFEEACVLMRTMELDDQKEFRNWCREGSRPSSVPSNPEKFYSEEWKSWDYFLKG